MSRRLDEMHADWLSLVEPEGQFLTLPVLQRAFPNGLDNVRSNVRADVRKHYPRDPEPTDAQWTTWIDWLLRDLLGWGPQYWTGSDVSTFTLDVPEHGTVLRAHGALADPQTGEPRVLVIAFPHGTLLDKRLPRERWNASPVDRAKELCKANSVRIGMVTDGELIVVAWVPDIAGGYATWPTSLFLESRERGLLQSFVSLLSASRFFAVREDVQIEALFEASEKAQNEVTNQLGFQIRQAVELLVNSISRANLERNGKLLATVSPQTVYEAAVTVMMRLVFMLYAEERELLPLGEPLYAQFYAASTLREQLDEQATLEGDEPLERRSAGWNRLLATFRIIYGGLNHDRLRSIAYGGRLFDPDRFPFLEGRTNKQKWEDSTCKPLPVDDLTVRAIMEAIQTLPIREGGSSERRRLSFRSLDVEQIGHVYEGLLDHGAIQVDDVYVGLVGKAGDEAEIPLSDIEIAAEKGSGALTTFLAEKTKRSEAAIGKLLKDGQMFSQGKDQEMRRLLNTVCDNSTSLSSRIAPIVYSLRRDLHGLPVVFPPGSLVVKQTKARRDSGTEYTPRELAEEMVKYSIEPLVYSPGPKDGTEPSLWKLRPSSDLLKLKICDPAVGSGAFLVAACRYLADRIVEAWILEAPQREKDDRESLTLDARRLVVDRCLYGVDRDSMAVEMAKLSLWLTTMHRERPFSFLDHSIREGDSLLGVTSLEQVYNVHLDPLSGKTFHTGSLFDATSVVRPLVERAAHLRQELESLPSITSRDAEAKQRLNDESNELLETVTVIGDAIVSVALSNATQGEKHRDAAYQDLASRVRSVLDPKLGEQERVAAIEALRSHNQQRLNAGRPESAPPRITMHWAVAFPEVFNETRQGFDAIVGNPPFAGGQKITGTFGSDYREYLLQNIGGGRRGSADLVAYFFLRAGVLSTTFGFLAIKTIAEGETRAVGLDRLLENGWVITRGAKSERWPGRASVAISKVWLSLNPEKQGPILNNKPASAISSMLEEVSSIDGYAHLMPANANRLYQGSIPLGKGFLLSKSEADNLVKLDSRNAEVIRPYINGEDLNSSPDCAPSRLIIDFRDWSIERAGRYPDCLRIIRERVEPERRTKNLQTYRDRWWVFAKSRPGLYGAIAELGEGERVLACSEVTKYLAFVWLPPSYVYSANIDVLPGADDADFGILNSSLHDVWARKWCSHLENRLKYSPTNGFENFPFPVGSMLQIEQSGKLLESVRSRLMGDRQIGITAAYNLMHTEGCVADDVNQLRTTRRLLDQSVLESYGWSDIQLDYGFHDTQVGIRWTFCLAARNEILNRLLQLNHERVSDDITQKGASVSGASNHGRSKRRRSSSDLSELRLSLMDANA